MESQSQDISVRQMNKELNQDEIRKRIKIVVKKLFEEYESYESTKKAISK